MATPARTATAATPQRRGWSPEEHERYLEALRLFPHGPWKQRAEYIGTRTTRQVMTHANKIALKEQRHARGLKVAGRRPRTPRDDDKPSASAAKTQVRRRRHAQRPIERGPAEALVATPVKEPVGTTEPLMADPAMTDRGFVEMMHLGHAVIEGLEWDDWMHSYS